MASRHHYSLPGASLLRSRSSSKKAAAGTANIPSSSQDTRQSSSSRAYYSDAGPRNAPQSRPSSATGYKTNHPNASVTGFQAPSSTRPSPAQRPATTPQPSSSRTRIEVPDTRSYFSKMFSRKQTPAATHGDEKHKSSSKRTSQAYAGVYVPLTTPQAPIAGPSTSWQAQDTSLRTRESDREERARQKVKDERARTEKTKEERERLRAEYAANKAREEAERVQAAAARAARVDRNAPRPSREESRQQDYESDNNRRRMQAQQGISSSVQKQEARQSRYLHPAQFPPAMSSRPTTSARDTQQTLGPQAAARPPGVPVQPSTSSQSTSASHQPQILQSTPPIRTEPSVAPTPSLGPPPNLSTAPAPPPKVTSTQYQTSEYSPNRNPVQPEVAPTASSMLPPYQPSTVDKNRLEREAAEREAQLSREREREVEKRREADREAAERNAVAAREREQEKRREADKANAERELMQHREREQEREQEREKRRARRAERERRKELENAERERQKEAERAERERLRAIEQAELEKQREAERLQRERKEYERAEKERARAERERREAEQSERERLREKAERDRERAHRSVAKHRTHRDKSQSLPSNPPPGVTSGSDTERITKTDARHRPQSQPPVAASEARPTVGTATQRSEYRRQAVPAPIPLSAQDSIPKQDSTYYGYSQRAPRSPMELPIAPPQAEKYNDIVNPRSSSAVPLGMQAQGLTPPKMPERSQTDPLLSNDQRLGSMEVPGNPTRWPHQLSEGPQAKLVSIYASQGPPDRTPYRATQKTAPVVPAAEHAPAPSLALPITLDTLDGRPRSSLDHSTHRAPTVPANVAPATTVPPKISQPAPSLVPPLEQPTAAQSIMTNHTITSAQQSANTVNSSSATYKVPPRADVTMVSLHGKPLPSLDARLSSIATEFGQQTTSVTQQPPEVPPVSAKHSAGFSSYSQTVLGLTKQMSRHTAQDQLTGQMSRVPSNNSTRSPSRKAAQLPMETPTSGAPSTLPISHTPSDSSQSTEKGGRQHLSIPQLAQQPVAIPSQSPHHFVPPASATPVPASVQNIASTARVPHESVTSLHHQAISSAHFQPEPHPHQPPYPYVSNKAENRTSRYDLPSNNRAAAPLSATIPDVSNHRYPSNQKSSPQSKANYNPQTNAPYSTQSYQQSQPMLPSSSQDNYLPSRSTTHANNISSYSAAIASSNPLSQMSSTVLSQQTLHAPQTSMYHNSSISHNDLPTRHTQHAQNQPASSDGPTAVPHSSNANYNTAPKPSTPSAYVTSTRPSGPFINDTPSSLGAGLSLDSPPPTSKPQIQNMPHSTEQATAQSMSGPPTTSTQGAKQVRPAARLQKPESPQDMDSPPPLTPSSSSRDSHEEILMTPASLDISRAQVNVRQAPDSSQRSEKRKGGIFGLFRSSSAKYTKGRDTRDRLETREQESRAQVQGSSSHDQRSESITRSRSARPPSIAITAEPDPNPTNAGSSSLHQRTRQSRASRHVPPPISIPIQSIPYRLFTSKSKRYRTMSSASLEALDGTANNTVVGSPTSSRISATSSGPLTPPIRDPIEAAMAWRNNEDVFLDPGSSRRRRPGVTFDVTSDEGQKDGAQYRRSSRLQRQRREPFG